MIVDGESRDGRLVSSGNATPHREVALSSAEPLLRVRNLRVEFRTARGTVRAVRDVSFDVPRGQTLGLVGESGCGKSTLGRAILGLTPTVSGEIFIDGVELQRMPRLALRRRVQIVFQDPAGSLNPRLTIETLIGEALQAHRLVHSRAARRARVVELLRQVGLPAELRICRPAQCSGGQKQRIGIARALSLEPELLICDEPVAALDASVQSQILNLLADLQRERGLTYLFVSHNLDVIAHFCDQIAVMYLGRIVECASAPELVTDARHPYTRALLRAAPRLVPRRAPPPPLAGDPPSPLRPPTGCAFHPRCPIRLPACRLDPAPPLRTHMELASPRLVACHRALEIDAAEAQPF